MKGSTSEIENKLIVVSRQVIKHVTKWVFWSTSSVKQHYENFHCSLSDRKGVKTNWYNISGGNNTKNAIKWPNALMQFASGSSNVDFTDYDSAWKTTDCSSMLKTSMGTGILKNHGYNVPNFLSWFFHNREIFSTLRILQWKEPFTKK